MQQHVDDIIKSADHKRSELNDFQGAIADYMSALKILDPFLTPYVVSLQQIGNCYKSLRQLDKARYFLELALAHVSEPWLRAAISRDLADVYRLDHDLRAAGQILDGALVGLNEKEHPAQYGITLSWIGRVERDKGLHSPALATFERAHQILHGAGNRSFELCNLLDLADQRCKCDHPMRGRQAAHQALELARMYGSRNEVRRAQLIMALGHDAQPIIKAVAQRKGR